MALSLAGLGLSIYALTHCGGTVTDPPSDDDGGARYPALVEQHLAPSEVDEGGEQ